MLVAENVLKSANLFVDGHGFAGNLKEVKLPDLSLKLEQFRVGGMDAPISIDKGMEELVATFTTTKNCTETLSLFGVNKAGGVQLTIKASLESYNGTVTPVVVTMFGRITKIAPTAWTAGGESSTAYTVNLEYYKYTQDGIVVHEIDVLNMKRIINGKDQLAQHRANLGL
ncbi:phage major tail tube protein [Halodesulfovibrio spirochaetisodalis]|uniref:Major tail tube protein n=1 Tax=Halodesulfovibrio spirochaetisodalis TaxID=1560234 RepID=A0A1B7XDK5_9BACT|nr:phage major tail tube protein [Halodesulfovibrio spirochaetisodalis]OBQ52119.1 major tail tube protein [Halodesulfovibrio spirochaetisodalis]